MQVKGAKFIVFAYLDLWVDMFLDWYLCITCSFKICCRFILILVVFACPSVASGVFESGQGTKRIMDSV
jgi:hypothetical protein